jgi:hypothetical protein
MTKDDLIKLLSTTDFEHIGIDDYSEVDRGLGYQSKYLIRIWFKEIDIPLSTDEWRENLKAWNLKQREEKELFTDDLQKTGSHYKGEF